MSNFVVLTRFIDLLATGQVVVLSNPQILPSSISIETFKDVSSQFGRYFAGQCAYGDGSLQLPGLSMIEGLQWPLGLSRALSLL